MAKPKKMLRRMKKSRVDQETASSAGSVRRGGRSVMEIVEDMTLGRKRSNQSTDSNQ